MVDPIKARVARAFVCSSCNAVLYKPDGSGEKCLYCKKGFSAANSGIIHEPVSDFIEVFHYHKRCYDKSICVCSHGIEEHKDNRCMACAAPCTFKAKG